MKFSSETIQPRPTDGDADQRIGQAEFVIDEQGNDGQRQPDGQIGQEYGEGQGTERSVFVRNVKGC